MMTTMIKLKKTLQPVVRGDKIVFGLEQEGLERVLENTEDNIKLLKYMNGEIEESALNLNKEELEEKINSLKYQGLLTINHYGKKGRYSRNINFFEWIDTSDNINPNVYQEKIVSSHILIVGLGGIGANVCEILVRMGVGTLTIVDNDTVDESNITRQGTYFESDIGKYKAEVVESYLKRINKNVSINMINKYISTKEDLKNLFEGYSFDLSICCADTPKYIIDTWFDELSIEFNRPFVSGSYASTVINTFCMHPEKTITSSELYGGHGATREQLLTNLSVPTSVIAPVTFLAAGLISYQTQCVITGLNYKPEAVQIDVFNWGAYKYDLSKK